MNDTNPDPYAVLGVAPTASRQQVNRAYRRLLRRHHPDTRADGTAPVQGSDGRVPLADVLAAYAVLGDPVTRAAHDRNRTPVPGFTAGSGTGPPVVPVAGPVPRPRSDTRRGPRTVHLGGGRSDDPGRGTEQGPRAGAAARDPSRPRPAAAGALAEARWLLISALVLTSAPFGLWMSLPSGASTR